jgi:TPP-dependent pyruvate/acetoin dehydrogenase alpha subunit
MALGRTDLLDVLSTMLLIRRFEERLVTLGEEGRLLGHFHVYVGQEVTGVAALRLLRAEDWTFTTHRNHGHLLARGADPGRLLAEILGRATGYNQGKGGTLHVACRELGFPSTSSMVGGGLPLATGAGLSARLQKKGQVAVALFGDGALEEGAFVEALNIAALWKLPVVYLCENNSLEAWGAKAGEYASSTLSARELCDIPRAYQVPSASIDGTDAGAVWVAMDDALNRARSGAGPSFIEAKTVRWPGSRPLWPRLLTGPTDLEMAWNPARISGEYATWHASQDGVLRFVRDVLAIKAVMPHDVQKADEAARTRISQAVDFAMGSPFPQPEAAYAGVFG